VLAAVDEGFRQVARDPVRIRSDVDRLSAGPRAYENAKDRLTAAGQFAVPIYLEYLQNNAKKDLQPFIIRLMGEIGRPLLNPLVTELRVADPTLRIALITVIGQIGYPQALPALRALEMDPTTSPQMKEAVVTAMGLIDRTGQAAKMSPAELYLAGGENYYDKKASYLPQYPEEKTNPVWYFDKNLNNVMPVQVPTEIWNYVMAMRMAESAIGVDGSDAGAISLWLAANLKREIALPKGMTDGSRAAGSQDAAFYAMAAGPGYMNPVLARALDDHDSALALRAITALEATGGVSGLVANADSPLVRALSHSDRAVRFKAAFALARANPVTQFPSYFRVVPVLCEAVNASASPAVLLVEKNEGMRNSVTEELRGSAAHYTVYGGDSISGALAQAQRVPAIDVVMMPADAGVERIAEIGRTDYRLAGGPILVMGATEDLATLRLRYAPNRGCVVIDEHSDEAAIGAALAKARADIGAVPLTAEEANTMSLTALHLLGTLAEDHRSIYAVGEATETLIGALKDKRPAVVAASASVIGKLNSPEGQRALATLALRDGEAGARAALFDDLAESAKRTGNALDGSQVSALIKIVTSDTEGKVRTSAAQALGALNVPSNQASVLILQQTR
jgi:hypothetical protein